MPSSRSRLRTVGAFGNQKPRPIGFVPRSHDVDAAAPQPRPSGPTLADKWLEFTYKLQVLDPIRGERPVSRTARFERSQAIRGGLAISRELWNVAVDRSAEVEAAVFKSLTNLKDPNGNPAVTPEIVRDLINLAKEIKDRDYADEKRSITGFKLKVNENGTFSFRIDSMNLNPEGLQRPEGTTLT